MAGCNIFRRLTFAVSAVSILLASSCTSKVNNPNYANNPAPLHPNVFIELLLGSIKADGNDLAITAENYTQYLVSAASGASLNSPTATWYTAQ